MSPERLHDGGSQGGKIGHGVLNGGLGRRLPEIQLTGNLIDIAAAAAYTERLNSPLIYLS